MVNKIYRNIYFIGNSMRTGTGTKTLYYTGSIFTNAKHIKDFHQKFDKVLDILITCNSCAAKEYGRIVKVKN